MKLVNRFINSLSAYYRTIGSSQERSVSKRKIAKINHSFATRLQQIALDVVKSNSWFGCQSRER
ncbi:MAG: hypothetical protein DMF74_07130 [Acidobacteria bacterium]|nr:MAG: hypothetical protein DMF74_07130 [Acidobacteriota bacterium]